MCVVLGGDTVKGRREGARTTNSARRAMDHSTTLATSLSRSHPFSTSRVIQNERDQGQEQGVEKANSHARGLPPTDHQRVDRTNLASSQPVAQGEISRPRVARLVEEALVAEQVEERVEQVRARPSDVEAGRLSVRASAADGRPGGGQR